MTTYPLPPRDRRIAFSYLALKVDLLAQVNKLLRPLHGLHAGVTFLHQLGVGWGRGIIWVPAGKEEALRCPQL